MTDQDGSRGGFPKAATAFLHESSRSIDSTTSSSNTLRDEEIKGLEAWSSPRKEVLDAEEDDHLLAIPTTPPPVDGATPRLSFQDGKSRSPKKTKTKSKTASWSSLPRKGQLALLTASRLAEPLTQTSLQSYMFYQLKSFDPSQSDSAISTQAGMLAAAFTLAQFVTAILWGRAADSERCGRKMVLLIGLTGTMISAIGFGFSKSYASVVFWRCLGGALNGNVGVMRTMISEIIKEKKFQSRAFMLLPMTFNIGVIIGPILGGVLSDPINQHPGIFGPDSLLGGKEGIWWMRNWPYALPNLVSACFLFSAATGLFLGLEETHEILKHRPDRGRQIGAWILRTILRRRDRQEYAQLASDDTDAPTNAPNDIEMQTAKEANEQKLRGRKKLPVSRIWTKRVVITLLAHATLAFHVGTFNNLWFIFLSTPRFDPEHPSPPTHHHQSLPFSFTGGLALPPARIGLALSILGSLGIIIQLFIYPKWTAIFGLVRSYRYSIMLFPLAYFLVPYLSLLPSSTAPPKAADGIVVWLGIAFVLLIQVMARTFALPATNILVNNNCPHPSILGTFHGIAQSISSLSRTIGPAVAGWLYGRGLVWGVVGTGFWGLGVAALVNNFAGCFVRDSDGHEILLEGEVRQVDEEEEDGGKR
ncbi:MFS general substrate transporter [Tothia fuscella]|uniref:MFS general substrate transporter n=1 Tax=Tothia fuscella TaxID=1048955 RepID=A0A9P4NJ11_9PEZI|nr:MFS general substrate transporter [Tothia fuscella]